jgi:hypothetical protein
LSFWVTIFFTILGIIKDTAPLFLKWMMRDADSTFKVARDKALELQQKAADTATLIKEENGDELSRAENFKLSLLEQLFKQRKLRKKDSPEPPK